MITINLLKNNPKHIPQLAAIWYDVLGSVWLPDVPMERVITKFSGHLNDEKLPITFIALDGDVPVGMCSLRENDGIRPDLMPWLASLVVDPNYQKQGIAKMLIDTTIQQAKKLGFQKLYLFAFDPTIPNYYSRLGWREIGVDEFNSYPVTVMEINL